MKTFLHCLECLTAAAILVVALAALTLAGCASQAPAETVTFAMTVDDIAAGKPPMPDPIDTAAPVASPAETVAPAAASPVAVCPCGDDCQCKDCDGTNCKSPIVAKGESPPLSGDMDARNGVIVDLPPTAINGVWVCTHNGQPMTYRWMTKQTAVWTHDAYGRSVKVYRPSRVAEWVADAAATQSHATGATIKSGLTVRNSSEIPNSSNCPGGVCPVDGGRRGLLGRFR